jgi:hypothetical protein
MKPINKKNEKKSEKTIAQCCAKESKIISGCHD